MGLSWLLVEFMEVASLSFPPLMEALLNSLQRQQGLGVEVTVKTRDLCFDSMADMLMQLVRVEVDNLQTAMDPDVSEGPEEIDWEGLRNRLASGRHVVGRVLATKGDAANCPRDVLRAVWDALSHSLLIEGIEGYVEFSKEQGEEEEGWQQLEQFIHTPDHLPDDE